VLSLLGALTYGELSAMRPQAGGLYIYIRDCFGPLPAFLYGWTLFFVNQFGLYRHSRRRVWKLSRNIRSTLRGRNQNRRCPNDPRHHGRQRSGHAAKRRPNERHDSNQSICSLGNEHRLCFGSVKVQSFTTSILLRKQARSSLASASP